MEDIILKADILQHKLVPEHTILSEEEAQKVLDEEMEKFLFSLGCYEGEIVTLVSILGDTYVIKIKDGRYSIDKQLATAISVKNI